MALITEVAEFAARAWLKRFKHAPKLTAVISIVATSVSLAIFIYAEREARTAREARLAASSDYISQVRALEETRRNLDSLVQFVETEKKRLQSSQTALDNLKNEHERIKPLLETDRKTIDALFAAQEARGQSALRTERWIGFGLGVISSLVASLVWAFAAYFVRRGKSAA
jgi:hypothetical protein